MKNNRFILIFFFIALNLFQAFSQSLRINELEKYWKYRHRLRDEFVRIGLEDPMLCDDPLDYNPTTDDFYSGYSIPAHEILINDSPYPEKLNFADQIIDLGWYIGVLATEYKLLKDNGQPFEETARELYYAMKAYERLDKKCEKLYYPKTGPCPEEAKINGLFCRDDIYFGIPDVTVYSSYIIRVHYYNNKKRTDYYPSGDQIIGLYLGLKLVVSCIDEADNYNGIYYYVEKARQYADAVASRLERDDYHMILDDGSGYETSDIGGIYEDYPLSKSAEQITGKKYVGDTYWAFQRLQNMEQEFFKGIEINGNDFVAGKLLANVAIGQSWGVDGTSESLHNWADYFGLDIYPILYYYLFGTQNQTYNKIHRFKAYLLALNAPESGPYYNKNESPAFYNGWAAANKWWRPLKAENGVVGEGISHNAKFNGLDYMLLHNLYWLQYPQTNNLLFNYAVPFQVKYGIRMAKEALLGTIDYPYIAYANKNIVSNSIVNTDSYLEFYAPTVYLTDGFKVNAGAYFKASTDDPHLSYHITEHFYPDYPLSLEDYKDEYGSENTKKEFIKIYPNPSVGDFTVQLGYPFNMECELRIYNPDGREVYFNSISAGINNFKVNADILTGGIYFLQLLSENKVYNQKIIIY